MPRNAWSTAARSFGRRASGIGARVMATGARGARSGRNAMPAAPSSASAANGAMAPASQPGGDGRVRSTPAAIATSATASVTRSDNAVAST